MKTLFNINRNLANFRLNSINSSLNSMNIISELTIRTYSSNYISKKKIPMTGLRSKPLELSINKIKPTYWNPTDTSNTLNDYQYIKCKWLFELVIGGLSPIHKNYGYILGKTGNGSLIRKDELGITRNYSTNWTNELLGEYSRIYYSVLTRPRMLSQSQHGR